MIRTDELRVPGVYFLPPPRAAAPELPPLDVAAFVGFAERGPLHTPVALEDGDAYRDVFGGDLPLALDAGGGRVFANVPGAVAGFFANGGRRAYAVRVAGERATRTRLAMPGVVALAGGTVRLASVLAAWEGRWAARLALAARLDITPLPASRFSRMSARELAWDTGSAPQAIQPGDVLRVTFPDGGQWLLMVASVDPIAAGSAGGAGPRMTRIAAGAIRRLTMLASASPPLPVHEVTRLTLDGEEPFAGDGLLAAHDGDTALLLQGDAAERVQRGDVLRLHLSDGSSHLLAVRRVEPAAAAGSPPVREMLAVGDALLDLREETLPALSPPALLRVERLRFDLAIWDGARRLPALDELTFDAPHPRFWGEVAFLESSPRFQRSAVGDAGQAAARAAVLYRQLRTGRRVDEAVAGRLDLTGFSAMLAPLDASAGAVFLPLGMPAVFDEAARVRPAPEDVGDDDLARFDPALFVDPYLARGAVAPPSGPALLADASDRCYVRDVRLRGLHSLLFVDEVALLSVPDATHLGWAPAVVARDPIRPAEAPAIPAPPPCPVSDFADCDQPPAAPAPPPPLPPEPTPLPLPALRELDHFDPEPLLWIHRAALGLCLARRDVVAILTLPRHFEKRQCIDWQEAFRQALGLPRERMAGGDTREIADLSYAAVYHPWLLVADPAAAGALRALPPDGAAGGTIAARERERQVWLAPANVPLAGVVGLTPALAAGDVADLFDRQFNLVVRQPRDFRVLSAHTLSDERSLLQLSVRRLLILLRKLAAERGMDLVFEPNDARLRDGVRAVLTDLLLSMFRRGAFAGRTADEAFRVVTDESVNTPRDADAGRFVALVQVAPAQPMEFLTVLLTRVGDGLLRATER